MFDLEKLQAVATDLGPGWVAQETERHQLHLIRTNDNLTRAVYTGEQAAVNYCRTIHKEQYVLAPLPALGAVIDGRTYYHGSDDYTPQIVINAHDAPSYIAHKIFARLEAINDYWRQARANAEQGIAEETRHRKTVNRLLNRYPDARAVDAYAVAGGPELRSDGSWRCVLNATTRQTREQLELRVVLTLEQAIALLDLYHELNHQSITKE